MGTIKKHPPVKYFAGLTFGPENDLEKIIQELTSDFAEIDHRSEVFDFDTFTNYYQPEMGENLKKIFLSFKPLINVESLPDLKLKSNKRETEYLVEGKRSLNIDPGYLTEAKIVLATTKDYMHRLYLRDGIFGDLHLVFGNKKYQNQPWTYPDYQSDIAARFFLELRSIYRGQIRDLKNDLLNKA